MWDPGPAYACANASGILIPSDHSQQWQVVVATWATMLLSGLRNCLDIVATRALNVCILSASASSGARAIPFTALHVELPFSTSSIYPFGNPHARACPLTESFVRRAKVLIHQQTNIVPALESGFACALWVATRTVEQAIQLSAYLL
jgi:hypothetical protein